MDRDILTVVKKELKEILVITFTRGHLLSSAFLLGIFGFFIPYEQGEFFLRQTSTSLSLYVFFVPLLICSGLVADSFAGERERKTLESLLSTRISNTALFTGKVLAIFIYTYVFLFVMILVSVIGVNYYLWKAERGRWFFFNNLSVFSLFVFTIPVILAGIAVGVFFSLRCRDLRTAFQFSRMGWFVVCLPLIFGWVSFQISWDFLIPGFYILFIMDGLLLIAGVRLFHRSKVII